MMRCRPGTVQSQGRALLGAYRGPGSAAHRFAQSRAEIMEKPERALALRRIRDTAGADSNRHAYGTGRRSLFAKPAVARPCRAVGALPALRQGQTVCRLSCASPAL